MTKFIEVVGYCAAVVTAGWLLAGSTAFTTAPKMTTPAQGGSAPQHFMGRASAPEEADFGATSLPLSIGVVVGVAAAAMAAANRGLVARKAEEKMVKTAEKEKLSISRAREDEGELLWKGSDNSWHQASLERAKKEEATEYFPKGTNAWIGPAPRDDINSRGEVLSRIGYIGWPLWRFDGKEGISAGPIGMWDHEIAAGPFAGGLAGSEYHGYGSYQWDPLGLNVRYREHLPWYREAELKHCRVAMLACVGLIAPDAFRIPLDIFSDPKLDMMTAHNKLIGPGLGEGPMWWLLLFCGIIESIRFKQVGLGFQDLTLENAGDMNFGKGFLPKTKEAELQMRVKELKNGRLAMLAFSGAITQGIAWETHHFPFVPQ